MCINLELDGAMVILTLRHLVNIDSFYVRETDIQESIRGFDVPDDPIVSIRELYSADPIMPVIMKIHSIGALESDGVVQMEGSSHHEGD